MLLCNATVKKVQDIICQQTNRPATTSKVSAVRRRSSRHLPANESTNIVILQIFNRRKSPQAHMASFVATPLLSGYVFIFVLRSMIICDSSNSRKVSLFLHVSRVSKCSSNQASICPCALRTFLRSCTCQQLVTVEISCV